jgi:hypothetical protein
MLGLFRFYIDSENQTIFIHLRVVVFFVIVENLTFFKLPEFHAKLSVIVSVYILF